ncbi:MAG: CoA-binding protein [Bacteroidales bacterium]|jgi:predicted CoA-binding protein|nr:CoA-binding protein [Bacteroidales bacterium]
MKDVSRFLSLGKYAIVGVSRDPKKFGQVMFRDLRKKGMDVVPVNPGADTIDGVKCFRSVSELPREVKGVIFMTPKEATLPVAREVIAHGIKDLWIQQGAETKEVISELEKEDINLIHNQCMLMFWKPNGIHSFHRFLKKIFGGLPA